eukprot:SM000141S00856  [mRNA]  locus=s141:25624:26639:- [translate_table: standard]
MVLAGTGQASGGHWWVVVEVTVSGYTGGLRRTGVEQSPPQALLPELPPRRRRRRIAVARRRSCRDTPRRELIGRAAAQLESLTSGKQERPRSCASSPRPPPRRCAPTLLSCLQTQASQCHHGEGASRMPSLVHFPGATTMRTAAQRPCRLPPSLPSRRR